MRVAWGEGLGPLDKFVGEYWGGVVGILGRGEGYWGGVGVYGGRGTIPKRPPTHSQNKTICFPIMSLPGPNNDSYGHGHGHGILPMAMALTMVHMVNYPVAV